MADRPARTPSSTWRRSSARRPPTASAGRPSGSPTSCASWASRPRSRRSPRTARTGGRSGLLRRRRGGGARRAPARARSGAAGGAPAIVDDETGRPAALDAALLPQRSTWNVVGRAGDPDAERTVVLVAHHDARARRPDLPARAARCVADTLPATGREAPHVAADDAARVRRPGAGRARGAARPRPLRKLGTLLSLGTRAGVRRHRPRARRARRERQPHARSRPCSSWRGACASEPVERRARAARLDRLGGVLRGGDARLRAPPRARAAARATDIVVLDTVGSPRLILLEGEGMICAAVRRGR